MFDVNSLGGKLIDNQNLKKALAEGGGGSFLPIIEFNATRQGGLHGGVTITVVKNELPSAGIGTEWNGELIVVINSNYDLPQKLYGYMDTITTDTIRCHSFPFYIFSDEAEENFEGMSCVLAEFKNSDSWQVGTTVERLQYEERTILFNG